MRSRTASITLAAALAAVLSVSAAQAGMNNLNVSPGLSPRATPSIPDVKVRPLMIDARIKLHCYYTRERNELGVWVTRRHCN
ncbi:hypothetical protein [Bradyrhizobium sp.]|uniref:hypothetical protein n=1 Tax=Bradyrhizobium sp. TaxID=376 RepID=UPI0040378286